MKNAPKFKIDLDQIDETNQNLACAQAIISVIRANSDCKVQLSSDVISQALHGVSLMIGAAVESLNGGRYD
jgi:hypothetical protein